MIRPLQKLRPTWSCMMRIIRDVPAPTRLLNSQNFHSTARAAAIGFKNFKNAPRLKWKVQRKLDEKNTEIEASDETYVPYSEAMKISRKSTWLGARKVVDRSRLFGPELRTGNCR